MKKFLMSVLFFMFFISMFGKIIYYGNIEPNGYTIENYSNINELRESLSSIENDIKDEYETTEDYNARVTQKVLKLNTKEFLINCEANYSYNSDAKEYNFTLDFDNCKEFLPLMFLKNEIKIPCPLEKAKKYRNNKIQAAIVISDIFPNIKNEIQEIVTKDNLTEYSNVDVVINSLKKRELNSKIKRIIFYSETSKEELFSIDNFDITLEDVPTYITRYLNGYITTEGFKLYDNNGNIKDFSNKKSMHIPNLYKCFDEKTGKYYIENINGKISSYFDAIEEIPLFSFSMSYIIYSKKIMVIKNNGKYGILNAKGEIVLDTIFDSVAEIINNYGTGQIIYSEEYIITKDGKKGIINSEGEIILDCDYQILNDNIDYIFNENTNITQENSDKIDEEFEESNSKDYTPIFKTFYSGANYSGAIYIKNGNKYGLFDIEKKQLLFPKTGSSNIVCGGNKNYMLIGNADLIMFDNELNINMKDSKFSIIKTTGETVIDTIKLNIEEDIFKDEIFYKLKGPIFYDEIFQCTLNGKNLIYGKEGKVLFSNAEIVDRYNENLIIKQNNKYGVIDKYGKIVKAINNLDMNFLNKTDVNIIKSYNIFNKNGKYGIKDSNNKEIITAKFDSIKMENEAYMVVKNGKAGILNTKTWEPIYYDTIKPSILNLFYITIDNSMGIIDNNGEYVLELSNFPYYKIFTKNCIFVKNDIGYWHSVDKNGKNKSDTNYIEIISAVSFENNKSSANSEYFRIVKGSNYKYGIVNSDGIEVLGCIADKIEIVENTPFIKITKEDEITYLNFDGSALGEIADNSKSYFSKGYNLPEVDVTSDVPVTIIYAYYPSINKIKVGLKKDNVILAAPKFDKLELNGEVATLSVDNFSVCVDCNEAVVTACAVTEAATSVAAIQ